MWQNSGFFVTRDGGLPNVKRAQTATKHERLTHVECQDQNAPRLETR
jgi:hypothetical protein